MKNRKVVLCIVSLLLTSRISSFGQEFEKDYIATSMGSLEITFIGHGSLMFSVNDYIIHVDPSRTAADYKSLPKADLILITHQHNDHCDPLAINDITKSDTKLVVTEASQHVLKKGTILDAGQTKYIDDFIISTIPAYNVVNKKSTGQYYHPKGEGVGYILTVGLTRIYIAGDTENTKEMKSLKDIDIAFLPMNSPYTMTPEMLSDGVLSFKPGILYPYHHRGANVQALLTLMEQQPETEVRIRRMY